MDGARLASGGFLAQLRLALSLARLRPFDTGTALGRSNERYRRIALTTVSTVAARGLATLTTLATVPLVLTHLGKVRFGLWSTITTALAWAALLDLGIAAGLVNLVSGAHGRNDREEAGRLVSTALAILVVAAASLGVMVAVAGPRIPWSDLLAVRGAVEDSTVRWAVLAALSVLVAGMPLSFVAQVYAGYQKSYVANGFTALGVTAAFAALVGAVRGGADLPVLVLVYGSGTILTSMLGIAWLFVRMPWLRPRPSAVSRAAARALLQRSLPLFLFQLGALAVTETQVIVLAHRCDLAIVAEYAIIARLYVLSAGLVMVSTVSFVPSFREAAERGDGLWVRAAFRQFLRVRMVLAVAVALLLVVAGNALLRIWIGREDIAFSPAVWATLAALIVAATWVQSHTELLAVMDRLWVLVLLAVANGAVTVTLTYLLAPTHGVRGAVMATAAVTVVLYSWILPGLARGILSPAGEVRPPGL